MMRILLMTGGLEPGRDGVGDYARLLAFECIRQGHACGVLALNDAHIAQAAEGVEARGAWELPTLRLPANLDWAERVERALAFRESGRFDWSSLQFVPYAFDQKGIVHALGRRLRTIVQGRPLHVMFHELWIGLGEKHPPLKDWAVGQIQRASIGKLIRTLRPRAVSTSNAFYVAMLKKAAIGANELPLFGNIPIEPVEKADRDGISQGLFFGTLHPEWKPEPFLGRWMAVMTGMKKRPRLISAGRIGHAGETVWKKLQADYGHGMDFVSRGEISAGEISILMQNSDFGLATSPWHLIGKSGSAAAMLDHGLPVIVTRDDYLPDELRAVAMDPLLLCCDANLGNRLREGLPRRSAWDRLPDIARKFIRTLAEAP